MFSLTDPAKIDHFQHVAVEQSRLHIPILFAYDTIHGYRTTFPVPLAEASSFDPDVAAADFTISARESAAVGIKQIYAPMVDVSHEPRWGRIVEGSGEDPYLGSVMAATKVRAAQGADYAAPDKVVTSVKHLAAYGAAEGGRDYNTTDVSERRLRDLFLPPFKAAVDAGADTAMCSFNSINGQPGCANPHIETDILKKEWGFDGFIESDYTAVAELRACPPKNPDDGPCGHGVAADGPQAGALALNAGTDSEMVSTTIRDNGKQLLSTGQISMRRLDDAVRRILRVKFRAGLFDNPYVDQDAIAAKTLQPADREAARKAAGRSMVLLKNDDNTLPLDPAKSVAVIGPLGDDQHDMLGPWWGQGKDEDAISLYTGIKAQNPDTTFTEGCKMIDDDLYDPANECGSDAGFAEAVTAAGAADQVVLALGETRGQGGEAEVRSVLDLPGKQQELLDAIKDTGKPVDRRAVQQPPAHAGQGRRQLEGDPRSLVPGHRGRQRRGRRPVRQGQPRRQAPGELPAVGRPDPDLLQPRADRPAVRRDAEVQLALPRPADVRAAVPVRLRPLLHDVQDRQLAVVGQVDVVARERAGLGRRAEHGLARGR